MTASERQIPTRHQLTKLIDYPTLIGYTVSMLVLLWKLNHKHVHLDQDTVGEDIGILCRNGEYRYVPWRGFIRQELAVDLRSGKPVKLRVERVGTPGKISTVWEDVDPQQHVQGCLTSHGVYAVLVEDFIRLV